MYLTPVMNLVRKMWNCLKLLAKCTQDFTFLDEVGFGDFFKS